MNAERERAIALTLEQVDATTDGEFDTILQDLHESLPNESDTMRTL